MACKRAGAVGSVFLAHDRHRGFRFTKKLQKSRARHGVDGGRRHAVRLRHERVVAKRRAVPYYFFVRRRRHARICLGVVLALSKNDKAAQRRTRRNRRARNGAATNAKRDAAGACRGDDRRFRRLCGHQQSHQRRVAFMGALGHDRGVFASRGNFHAAHRSVARRCDLRHGAHALSEQAVQK